MVRFILSASLATQPPNQPTNPRHQPGSKLLPSHSNRSPDWEGYPNHLPKGQGLKVNPPNGAFLAFERTLVRKGSTQTHDVIERADIRTDAWLGLSLNFTLLGVDCDTNIYCRSPASRCPAATPQWLPHALQPRQQKWKATRMDVCHFLLRPLIILDLMVKLQSRKS